LEGNLVKHVSLSRLIAGSVAVAAIAAVAPSPALASGNTVHAAALAAVNGGFTPLTPERVLDTRTGTGGVPTAQVAGHGTVTFTLGGVHGVPATGVSAVVLNVTATDVGSPGPITVFPAGTTRPLASNLNVYTGQTVANLVTVAMGAGGQISLYNGAAKALDLVSDVSGYYTDGTVTDSGAFVSMAPTRILDTRTTHAVAPGGTLDLQVSGAGGAGGVPASGAGSVVMNLTVTGPVKAGYITAYPAGTTRPTASNLNFTAGRTVPNLVTVGLGTGGKAGKVTLFNGSSGTVQLVADAAGYYLAGTGLKAGTFNAVQPTRILDTRVAGLGTPTTTPVPGRKDVGIQVEGGVVPLTNVSAVVTNLTLTGETKAGYLTAYPTAPEVPLVSNLNHSAAQTIANSAIIQPGLCGKVTLLNGSSGTTHMIADVSGYFLTKAPGGVGAKTGKAWGDNDQGELGTGTILSSRTPAAMPPTLRDLHAIDGDGLAVSNDGNVWGFGPEELTQLYGRNASTDVGFGNCSIPERITDGLPATIAEVGGSPSDAYALDASGDVYAWGINDVGQLANGTTTDNFSPTKVAGLTGTHPAIAIGAGLALLSDGSVWAWGDNSSAQLGDNAIGSSFSPAPVKIAGLPSAITAIAQSGDTSYALDGTGHVWAWGSNDNGALGQGINHADSSTPLEVVDVDATGFLSNVSAISGGMALLMDGSIMTWGDNSDGQLGHGTTTGHYNTPAPVTGPVGMPTFTKIAAGGNVDTALGSDGSVWAWGAARASGLNLKSGTPTQVIAPAGAIGVGAGVSAAFAVVP
jgi:alpha-tubulin suppressor-like RCC1 family protein